MGKGDKKSKKGKIWKGSYGNSRKRKDNKNAYVPVAAKVEKAEVVAEPKAKPVKVKAKKAVKKKAKPAKKTKPADKG